jgi:hypothetical protein
MSNVKGSLGQPDKNLIYNAASSLRSLTSLEETLWLNAIAPYSYFLPPGEGINSWRPPDDMLYELGAASFLYGDRIIILQESSLEPALKFRDIAYISFTRDKLEDRSLDLIKQLLKLGIVKMST